MRKLHQSMLCLLMLFTLGVQAQTKQITGTVTDASGSPIPSATIRIRGTKTGTSAGMDGTFKINVPSNAILVISGVGYEAKEFKTSGLSTLSAQLSTDSRSLSEVVVTGVGTATSKKNLGISVESIGASKLPAAPSSSIDQALIGKIPGAQISSFNGTPGAPVNILLRGINTVQGGTKPLILIDGIEVRATDINSLDLTNIDRVEVVQGAASATLYGAQGANGVIQLFTKKGKQGSVAINYSTSYASNEYINSGNVRKSALHSFKTDANNNIIDPNTGVAAVFFDDGTTNVAWAHGSTGFPSAMANPGNISNKAYNANFKYYDQFKQVFGKGYALNNSINISGASEKSDFAITVSNNHTTDIVRGNGYADRTNLTANLGTELLKGFRIRSISQIIYTKNTLHPFMGAPGGAYYGEGNQLGGSTNGFGGIYGFLNTSPFFSLTSRLADGTLPYYQTAGTVSVNSGNPFYNEEYASGLGNKVDIIQNFDANYRANRFLELDAKYGINFRTEDERWTFLNQSGNINSNTQGSWVGFNAPDNTGEIDDWNYKSTFQNFTASANIRTDFQKDFHINLPITTSTLASFDYRKNSYREYDTYGVGLPTAPPINLGATGSQAVALDYLQPFITYGYLLNQKIDFGNYGGIEGGFRTDWSSVFGGGHSPFTFPRADAYVAPSAFDFWQNGKLGDLVPYFKLRAAYGKAGIQPLPFQNISTITQGHLGSSGAYTIPTVLNNPALQVEVSREFEVGTDFSINLAKSSGWLSQINGAFTYWTRNTNNAIYQVSVPLSIGSPNQIVNAINLSSNGYQFQLNLPVYKSKSLSWDFTANFSHQTSMINSIHGAPNIILTLSAGSTALVLAPGQKIGQIYGSKAITSFSQNKLDGTSYIAPADYGKYQKVNGRLVDTATKGIQFTDDTYSFGDPNPKFNISFINGVTYKNFLTLSFQLDWVYGSHLYNQTKEWMYRDGIHGDYANPVTINGTTAAYTAYYRSAYADKFGSQNGNRNGTKDYFYEDASFVRLRNVSLAVDVAKFTSVRALKKVQLVLSGRNLITWTKYTGFDPEISSGTANSSYERGVDHNSLPNVKSYQVGLNVGL